MNRRIEFFALARQFLKFGTVGFIGFLTDTALLYAGINLLHLGRVAASMFSFPFSVSVTWFGNRTFTFREIAHEPPLKQLGKFAAICAVGLIFNRGTYALCVLTWPLAYAYPVIGLVAGTAAGMFFNFFVARKHVFK